ncbi:prepilin-type N-terminal cleavage/methylation domain-containing protein [Candidatus Sumerlaeota bacterium]|nr:prepilin-type N-terminal cleavage/methylation domain-containing protein [Candidatus Sumerlaeota bacterium]
MKRNAFTFVELTVVMTIIAILAAIAIPNFLEFQTRARVSRTRADQAALHAALQAYRLDQRAYPPNRQAGVADQFALTALTTPMSYISRLPIDEFSHRPTDPFFYYNGLQVNPETGVHIQNPDALMNGFTSALVWSVGPDHNQDEAGLSPDMQPDIQIDENGEVRILLYDPTNGTTSNGDILLLVD